MPKYGKSQEKESIQSLKCTEFLSFSSWIIVDTLLWKWNQVILFSFLLRMLLLHPKWPPWCSLYTGISILWMNMELIKLIHTECSFNTALVFSSLFKESSFPRILELQLIDGRFSCDLTQIEGQTLRQAWIFARELAGCLLWQVSLGFKGTAIHRI